MLNIFCDKYPEYNWNGFERVYAIIGLQYRNYLVVDRFVEIPNSSITPSDTFTVIAKDLLIIAKTLCSPESIVGFAHTHPPTQPIPSDDDIKGIGINLYGLVICENNKVWYTESGEIVPNYLRD